MCLWTATHEDGLHLGSDTRNTGLLRRPQLPTPEVDHMPDIRNQRDANTQFPLLESDSDPNVQRYGTYRGN